MEISCAHGCTKYLKFQSMDTMNKCEPCVSRQTESISVNRCIECQENLCLSCSEHHKAYKAFKNHHLVNIKLEPTLEREIPTLDVPNIPNWILSSTVLNTMK